MQQTIPHQKIGLFYLKKRHSDVGWSTLFTEPRKDTCREKHDINIRRCGIIANEISVYYKL